MNLFDAGERTDTRYKRHSEPEFAYLNQSARPSVIALRSLLEEWYDRVPAVAQPDLRSRFRSNDDYSHASAFFELYLHELLRKLGYTLTVHPPVQGSGTHPDFLVSRNDGCEFYMEATLAGIPSKAEQGAQARIDQVYDVLDRMDSPDFFIRVALSGSPATPPPGSRLRGDVERWLRTVDLEAIASAGAAGDFHSLPRYSWNHEGWEIELMPIAKSPAARGKPGVRPLGMFSPEAQWLQTDADLKDALEAKAKKYGVLEVPFIIAVNFVGLHCDECDILNCLVGQESTVVSLDQNNNVVEERAERKRNGFWFGPSGPRNQGVSGVLVFPGLNEWNMAVLDPKLYHNPWATRPLSPDCWALSQRIPNTSVGRFENRPGRTAGEVLGLPDPWPPSWD